jgi:alpha-beta hydrolase superfamily lysophospholipase
MRKIVLRLILILFTLPVLALKPEKAYKITPDSLGLAYKEQYVKSKDQFDLITWTYRPNAAKDKQTVIVLAYGDAGNMSHWVHQARILSEAGYRVITFDYRGFGKSTDFAIHPDYLYYNEFAWDLRAIMDFARKTYPQSKQGLLAFSMGTIMATLVLPQTKTDFFVGEGYVKDPASIVNFIKRAKNKDIILPPGSAAYPSQAPKITCPMLLIAGKADQATTLADADAVTRQAKNRKVVTFEGGHGMGFQALTRNAPGDLYVQAIDDFVK